MIKDTSKSDIVEIRALSDEEIEATSGAGILSDIWDGICDAVSTVVDFVIGAFNGPPQPWRGPFGPRPL